jgi:prepilin-type N-terminal cleavage/methylation domain-containing protein/prepilin-type processing-associated H-X9-DG protein
MRTKATGKQGFTLIELLVVISIIALLVGILLPALGAARRSAQNVVCKSNLRSTGLVLLMYAEDNDGTFPNRQDYDTGVQWSQYPGSATALFPNYFAPTEIVVDQISYVRTSPILDCPSNPGRELGLGFYSAPDYVLNYFMLGDLPINEKVSVKELDTAKILLADGKTAEGYFRTWMINPSDMPEDLELYFLHNNGKSANFLWTDGHVDSMTPEEMPEFTGKPGDEYH